MASAPIARRYFIRGRVQGVGFRYYAQRAAEERKLGGYVRNLEDGSVEVYAVGAPEKLADFAGALWKGPAWSEVRAVDEQEAALQRCASFEIR
jgi:Acylphosphatases